MHGVCWSALNKPQLLEAFYGPESDLLSPDTPRHLNLQIDEIKYQELNPPTYFKTNEFTEVFQEIVDTYGVPSYKEINPAYYTTITFPFLFGIMFGDIGHGALLVMFTTILICFEKRILASAPQLDELFRFRYMLLLMGIFAMFCGFIYNDFLSIPLNLFGSCYNLKTGQRNSPNCVYKAGIDPVWYISTQEILVLNSIKMKISVIFGVAHMTLGLIQKGLNAIYFKKKSDFIHVFLP